MNTNSSLPETPADVSRRFFFKNLAFGLGGAALSTLFRRDAYGLGADAGMKDGLHHAARAKRVIYIHLVGAPSHLDLFDYKPELQKRSGELCPDAFFEGKQLAFIREQPNLLGTPKSDKYAFSPCGQSGRMISNLLPHLQGVADELCFIKSMYTEQFNHAPAQLFSLTGSGRLGRPSIGSWMNYGLGSENDNLPGFVVLNTGQGLGAGNNAWGSGFLPTQHQGVEFRGKGDPVLYLSNPKGMTDHERHESVNTINALNGINYADVGDPEIATRIRQYELAYRMQTSVPELMETDSESEETHAMYGSTPGQSGFANHCLLARRLVERGVRFVQLFDQGWDHHNKVFESLPNKCKQVDQPIAALIKDLKQRGMLDDTLVVWSAEFGRTPMGQTTSGTGENLVVGRDHHKEAYTVWMAGGGVKPGYVHGASDELGYNIARDPVHVHDFNATIMHLLGIDHERLTFRYQGRSFRLTDVHGEVVKGVLS